MKRREAILFAVILLAVSVMFARAIRIGYFTQALDEAYFLESIDTTNSTGKSQTFLTASVIVALKDLIVQPASVVCAADLAHPRLGFINIYERHAFPILYLLALVRFFTDSLNVLILCAVIAFPGVLGCVYAFARRFGCPPWLSSVLVVLTAAHPAWSYAAFGQFYPDKLFPFFCLIYLAILYEYLSGKRTGPWMLLAFGILAASTSERSALMLVAATGAATLWFLLRRGWRKADLVPLAFTTALALYAYGYMHYVQVNSDYTSFGSSAANFLKAGFDGTGLSPASRKFLAINAGLLFPFSLGGGMWAAVAAGSLFPNLIGSVAGAEKLGWTTHYHSAYFPFLIFAVIIGAATLYRRSRAIAGIAGALAVAQAGIFLTLNPVSPEPLLDLAPANIRESALAKIVEVQIGTESAEFLAKRASFLQSLAKMVPEGSEVSAVEPYMPALYNHGVHLIHFYPLGMGKARYVIVPYATMPTGKVIYKGHTSFLGPAVAEDTDRCLTARLDSTYRLAHLVEEYAGGGTAILELK